MISYYEAKKMVEGNISPIEDNETVNLIDAQGLVLFENIIADLDNPPFTNSAMDGFALKWKDIQGAGEETPVKLNLVDDIAAGTVSAKIVQSGQAARVMTGAPIPKGTDTVIMQENAKEDGCCVNIFELAQKGQNIRKQGEDIKKGCVVLHAGDLIKTQEIAMLAMLGCEKIKVCRRPRVSIIATGSELVSINQEPSLGKIRDVNTYTLLSQIKSVGAIVVDYSMVEDSKHKTRRAIETALESSDILLITGGVSVGRYDFVKDVLEGFGIQTIFWRVNIKPGKPLLFAKNHKKFVFGLPGNPISTMNSFEEFVKPALFKMMHKISKDEYFKATLTDNLVKDPKKVYFLFGQAKEVKGVLEVKPIKPQGSGMLSPSCQGNAVIFCDEGLSQLDKGDEVKIRFL